MDGVFLPAVRDRETEVKAVQAHIALVLAAALAPARVGPNQDAAAGAVVAAAAQS